MRNNPIALCMIVKDEPVDRLAMLIEYMKPVVSQVVIADTGSQEKHLELYQSWGVEAYEFPFGNSFADARNSTLERVRPGIAWILHLDADELPSVTMIEHLNGRRVAPMGKEPLGWQYFTVNYFFGKRAEEMPYHWHCRLFRFERGRWYKPVHEGVELDGNPEHVSMEMGTMKHASKRAYLIHSKPVIHRQRAITLYPSLGAPPVE